MKELPLKVLIVEDDPSYQKIISAFVEANDQLKLIAIVDNSVDAVMAITKKKPDILLLDMEISGLNGLEVLDSLDHQPVTLVISGNSEFKVETLDFGIVDFIEKPIASAEVMEQGLKKCIAQCMNQ